MHVVIDEDEDEVAVAKAEPETATEAETEEVGMSSKILVRWPSPLAALAATRRPGRLRQRHRRAAGPGGGRKRQPGKVEGKPSGD